MALAELTLVRQRAAEREIPAPARSAILLSYANGSERRYHRVLRELHYLLI